MALDVPSPRPRVASRPLILLCLALGLQGHAQSSSTLEPAAVWRYAGPSLAVPIALDAFQLVSLAAPGLSPIVPWVANPGMILAHVPLYFLDWRLGMGFTAAQIGLSSAGLAAMFLGGDSPFLVDASSAALYAYVNTARFSTYATYREARLRVDPSLRYRQSFLPQTYLQALTGPFIPSNTVNPLVLIPAVAGTAALATFSILAVKGTEHAVWRTGTAYVGDRPVHPVAGFVYSLAYNVLDMAFVAAGEEALYRGVIYEELARNLGSPLAKATDAVWFPLVHLGGDVRSGLPVHAILFNAGFRAAMTLVYDFAYDRGGLPLCTAAHFWSDVLLLTARWLVYGGAPPAAQ